MPVTKSLGRNMCAAWRMTRTSVARVARRWPVLAQITGGGVTLVALADLVGVTIAALVGGVLLVAVGALKEAGKI